jgi:hypothetical protein
MTERRLVGDVHSHVATPAFSSIEGDDADRIFILPIEQVADQRRAVSSCFVSLTPRPTETAEIVKHEINIFLSPGTIDGEVRTTSSSKPKRHPPLN